MKIEIVGDVVTVDGIEYRRKPQTLTYTITIPEPLREAPPMDTEYYIASLDDMEPYAIVAYWENVRYEHALLKRGLCFATKADAIAAAKAMLPLKQEGAA